MDPKSDRLRLSTEPYRRETIYCMIVDLLILSVFSALILTAKVYELFFIALAYIIVEMMTNYYVFFASVIERKFMKFSDNKVKIMKIREEISTSGWLFTSAVGFLYPKKDHMKRYIILAKDTNDRTIKIRTVMTSKKAQHFSDTYITGRTEFVNMRIGNYSRILYNNNLT